MSGTILPLLNTLSYIFKKGNQEGYLEIKNVKGTVDAVMMLVSSIELPLYLQNKYTEYESILNDLVSMMINSLRSVKK